MKITNNREEIELQSIPPRHHVLGWSIESKQTNSKDIVLWSVLCIQLLPLVVVYDKVEGLDCTNEQCQHFTV